MLSAVGTKPCRREASCKESESFKRCSMSATKNQLPHPPPRTAAQRCCPPSAGSCRSRPSPCTRCTASGSEQVKAVQQAVRVTAKTTAVASDTFHNSAAGPSCIRTYWLHGSAGSTRPTTRQYIWVRAGSTRPHCPAARLSWHAHMPPAGCRQGAATHFLHDAGTRFPIRLHAQQVSYLDEPHVVVAVQVVRHHPGGQDVLSRQHRVCPTDSRFDNPPIVWVILGPVLQEASTVCFSNRVRCNTILQGRTQGQMGGKFGHMEMLKHIGACQARGHPISPGRDGDLVCRKLGQGHTTRSVTRPSQALESTRRKAGQEHEQRTSTATRTSAITGTI